MASGAKGPRAGQPKRRAFTAAYKLKIVEQYEQLADPRERGALLRREGLCRVSSDTSRKISRSGASCLTARMSRLKNSDRDLPSVE